MSWLDDIAWNPDGLVPAVVIDQRQGRFLMLAWMNRQAVKDTVDTGFAHFYSRSRQSQWKKGETSGNTLEVCEIRLDCDGDTVLLQVNPAGPACHTGSASCAFRKVKDNLLISDNGPSTVSSAVLGDLAEVIENRRLASASDSYTRTLLDGAPSTTVAKLAEEQRELADELQADSTDSKRVVEESADLIFHWMVALAGAGVLVDDVWDELRRRFGTGGHTEKAARGDVS